MNYVQLSDVGSLGAHFSVAHAAHLAHMINMIWGTLVIIGLIAHVLKFSYTYAKYNMGILPINQSEDPKAHLEFFLMEGLVPPIFVMMMFIVMMHVNAGVFSMSGNLLALSVK